LLYPFSLGPEPKARKSTKASNGSFYAVVTRVEIGFKPGVRDPKGESVAAVVKGYLNLPVQRVRTVNVYKIDADLKDGELKRVLEGLSDPVVQVAEENKLKTEPCDWTITVGFRPGVTDNVGGTAKVTLEDVLGRSLGPDAKVYTETRYLFEAPTLTRVDTERIATGCLANLLIETVKVDSGGSFEWRIF
jgi:phosphoribosylformylglycinamidine synthase